MFIHSIKNFFWLLGNYRRVPLSSTHQFHTRTTPSQPPKSLSSTLKSPQFHTKKSYCKARLFRAFWCWTQGFFVLNWGGCVELRVFWNGTEGGVLNWGVFGVELRDFGAEKEWPFCLELMCWTEGVSNWGGPTIKGGWKTYAKGLSGVTVVTFRYCGSFRSKISFKIFFSQPPRLFLQEWYNIIFTLVHICKIILI